MIYFNNTFAPGDVMHIYDTLSLDEYGSSHETKILELPENVSTTVTF